VAVQVNPNRMELLKLRRKQVVARRGHKLLKDKLEGLLRDFLRIVREYKELRRAVDGEVSSVFGSLVLASAGMDPAAYRAALAFPACTARLDVTERHVMNVRVPAFRFSLEGSLVSYGLADTNRDLDRAMGRVREVLERMVRLAEVEKTVELVAAEIERTRRRVNALEYILIPQQDEAIAGIEGKLDEMERSNTTRLMKIKEMLGS
jgi:V/A-type H+/Na+-transporting ATPase subunit D